VTPAPHPRSGATDVVRLVCAGAGLAAIGAVLWLAGAALPGPGTLDQPGLERWLQDDPAVAAFALVRLVGLALTAWVALSTAASLLVHGTRLRRHGAVRRLVDRLCLPAVRRLVHGAIGAGLSIAALVPGAATAAPLGAPAAATADADGFIAPPATVDPALAASTPGGIAVLVALAPSAPHDPTTARSTGAVAGSTTAPPDESAVLRSLAPPVGTATPPASPVGPSTTTTRADPARPGPEAPPSPSTTVDAPAAAPAPPTTAPSPPIVAERAALVALDAPLVVPAPAPATPAASAAAAAAATVEPQQDATWVVARGDHLWHVSETTLARHLGIPPDDDAVAAYVRLLVVANRDRFVVPDDPDLVFAGQELRLPPIQP